MKESPYFIDQPALISFSGGRTSAMMLYKIIDAHGGNLPEYVKVTFANTGKEREETLRFVHECSSRWSVEIIWLEYHRRKRGDAWEKGFEIVGLNSASRNGEPFNRLIEAKKYLPNPVTRFCTTELKIRVMRDFAKSIGWENWLNIVGLRRDEMLRVFKGIERNENGGDPWTTKMPMASAPPHGINKRDVLKFWLGDNINPKDLRYDLPQGFDLGLADYEGNCDLCMLKSRSAKMRIIRENKGIENWWIDAEENCPATNQLGAQFRSEESLSDIAKAAHSSPLLPFIDDDDGFEGCDLICAGS